ncbi:3-oxoacyl-[acyl-carrier-protein] reductase [Natranaerofaba carboxydovora]|uniref:3-oxoacyl-[acyl-carrier-protein] reductase n=1 Tax=Natranaerofaba carboxydovora TaxID=2742683 RepID=UPI001F13D242|nr:3-oxoacyl-[acyl-carrier-protein] reductase [Natranaerofaba carboxydovora]UMZ74139.1 3-oxoacyl-[acyl-carrier-protein] reductase FabG [Natranaerofaba carboxydovora]
MSASDSSTAKKLNDNYILEKLDYDLQPLPLEDKVAVVTGGANGIGAAISEKLAKLGANVVINYNKSQKQAQEVVSKIQDEGSEVLSVAGDVAQVDDMNYLANQTYNKFGKIDLLINNAGITKDNLMTKMEPKDWYKVVDVNLNGVFNSTNAVLPAMKEQKDGCIINISSIIGQMGGMGQCNYSAAKAGIIGFTKSLAQEMIKYNVRVNAVCPGFVETKMTEKIPDNIKEKIIKKIPMGRFADKEEIAHAVTFLIVHGTYITGQTININGGMYM